MPANERIFTEKNYVTINDLFLLVFTEVDEDSDYILRKINSEETTVLRSFYDTFYFKKEHQYHFDENGDSEDCDEYYGKAAFIIGKVEGDYIKLDKYVFQIDTNIYINRDLLKKYGIKMDIQIIRPHATIIAGRSNKFDPQQINDFRIIKRKFSNIADIISYDDLIQRLERLIESVEKKSNQ